MTHDELLAKLAYTPHTDPNGDNMHKALHGVLKLHKPQENEYFAYKGEDGCLECGDRSYPCPTVLAIELNLQ